VFLDQEHFLSKAKPKIAEVTKSGCCPNIIGFTVAEPMFLESAALTLDPVTAL